MVAITLSELALLRSQPHETNLWLSIYKPSTILACQINDASIAPGARPITYNNVTEGSYTNIWYGMTMYVGTTPGGRDVGRIRVRSATSTIIYVAENSDIEWADDLYLTVVDFYEINAMYPRMDVPDPADPTQQVWYKDYDIPYTNQNDVTGTNSLGSLVCMGSHYAGFIEPDTGVCDVYYSASGTFTLVGANANNYSCAWNFGGGSPTGSSAHAPGFVSYATPGHYTTKLIVTSLSSGAVDVSYRHISIYNRPENGTNVPILELGTNLIGWFKR